MNEQRQMRVEDIRVDTRNLYREEVFTDLKVASIRQLTPVSSDGSRDLSRPIIFIGQTQLMSQMGMIPVQTEIEAASLEDAMQKFPEAIRGAVDELMDEARDMQRKELSRIVVPDAQTSSKIIGG